VDEAAVAALWYLIVYRENNPVRDMTFHQIAQAVTKIEQSGMPMENACHNLNFWR
jgi:hypothetical protein